MKALRVLTITLAAVVLSISSIGCSKKSKGGSSASTPGSSCTYNSYYGAYVDSQGRYCNNYGGQSCQSQGLYYDGSQWRDMNGTVRTCNENYNYNQYVPYNNYYGGGCQGWSQMYGIQYVPVDIGYGQYVCANVQWLSQYNSQIGQMYNYDPYYFYNNPIYAWSPYDQGYGGYYGGGYNNYNYCGNSASVSFGGWNWGAGANFCF